MKWPWKKITTGKAIGEPEIEHKYDIRYINTFTPVQQALLKEILAADDPYSKIWVAHICIDLIAKSAAAVPVNLMAGKKKIENDPVYNLLFNYPNKWISANELMYGLVAYFYTNGNSYLYALGAPTKVLEIWPLNSNKVTPEPGDKNDGLLIRNYKVRDDRDYLPAEICHIKAWNPSNPIKGLSKFSALSKEIEAFTNMKEYQSQLYKGGRWPMTHFDSPGQMTSEQAEEMKKKIREQQQNWDNFILTHSGFKAEAMSFSPQDMNLIASISNNASAIATTLGVPAEMLGGVITSKGLYTYKEARKQFYQDTLLPLLQIFLDKFNAFFYPKGDRQLVADLSKIDALKMDFNEIQAASCMTIDEKRIAMGLEPTGAPEAQRILIPSGYTFLDQLGVEEFPEEL